MPKRHILRISAVFFILLLLLTFLSRTVYRRMLPNVEVAKAAGGMLKYAYTSCDICIAGERSVPIQIPIVLTRPLTVSQVKIKANQYIAPGDVLVTFYPKDGEYLIREAKRKLDLAAATLAIWKNEHENRVADMTAAVDKSKRKAEKERLGKELALLEAGIMDGTTETQLQAETTLWEDTLKTLESLAQDQWRIKAETSGYVEQILVRQGDGYSGLSPLINICPEGTPYRIGCTWKDAPGLRAGSWAIQGTAGNAAALDAVDVTTTSNGDTVWFEPNGDTPPPDHISSVLLSAASPYCLMLIDNKAIDGDKLYLLKSKTGAWGQTEYYAQEVRVRTGGKDGRHTEILSGLNYNDLWISSWNKPLGDGAPVVLASYE